MGVQRASSESSVGQVPTSRDVTGWIPRCLHSTGVDPIGGGQQFHGRAPLSQVARHDIATVGISEPLFSLLPPSVCTRRQSRAQVGGRVRSRVEKEMHVIVSTHLPTCGRIAHPGDGGAELVPRRSVTVDVHVDFPFRGRRGADGAGRRPFVADPPPSVVVGTVIAAVADTTTTVVRRPRTDARE